MGAKKARDSDPATLHDADARPVDRAAALSRLASDQRREFEQAIRGLLSHRDPNLRTAAVRALVGRWHLAAHVPAVEHLLETDPDWVVRRNCALALASYARARPLDDDRPRIVDVLVHRLLVEPEPAVQAGIYDAIHRLFDAPPPKLSAASGDFVLRDDVDWDWLRRHVSLPPPFDTRSS
jgi:hypothetical protein